MTESQPQTLQFNIRRGLLSKHTRQLILTKKFIRYEGKDPHSKSFTEVQAEDITAFRYGIRWLQGYAFNIGREYQVEIQYGNKQVLKICFLSLYGIHRKEYHELYAQILDGFWNFYFVPRIPKLLKRFTDGEVIELCNTPVSQDGIIISSDLLTGPKSYVIPMEQAEVRTYTHYFVLCSKEDPGKINKRYSFLDDWNALLLMGLLLTILEGKHVEGHS
ncbi:MAG: hypothetical protein H6585_08390 [Flavobacteriales bacterium]|nr:hypothetical protein [Flavobacteriales bacterium]MCB9448347.1 hypothetical protein [Flavobacteriales bacterium]